VTSRRLLPWALLGLLAGSAAAQDPSRDFIRAGRPEPLPAPLAEALGRLEIPALRAHLAYLTAPARQGRGLGTPGLAAAGRYLEAQLAACGIAPLGRISRQVVPMREVRPAASTLRLHGPAGTFSFSSDRDAVLPDLAPGTLSGPLVFAGYGIQEPALGRDDFKELDVRGKVVAFLGGLPPGAAWQRPDLIEKYASPRPEDRYDARLAALGRLGAQAAIALEETLDSPLARPGEAPPPYFLAAPGVPASGEVPLARIVPTPRLRAWITAQPEGSATLTVRGQVRPLRGFNVLGRLEGSDPEVRGQAVLLGAHMDHLGMPRGILHPGADDNASGVAALLEIARSLSASPVRPRRTILFAFWTGEEEGKFGSGHYVRHPRWPLEATVAYLNLDMIAHPWTPADLRALVQGSRLKDPAAFLDDLDPADFAEPGVALGREELGPVLACAGRGTGMSLHLDWTDGRDGGSDYRDFARHGVPFVRFFGSYFPGYHKPEDTLDRLDPAQVRRMARLALATAWLLADQ
jgi:hypothetical protein